MRIHKLHTLLQGILTHYSIGVEQEHILPFRLTYGLIIGTSKSHVLLVFDERHLRKAFAQILHRAVRRQVVHHEHLHLQSLRCTTHRLEALLQVKLDVVVDDDDRQSHRSGKSKVI